MDPFSDDEDIEPAPPNPARVRRPWWMWNYFTLAGVLFFALWIRELGGLPLAATGFLVVPIFAMWLLVPVALTGTPLWVPLPNEPGRGSRKARTGRRAGTACRIAAVLIGSVGLVQGVVNSSWMLAQAGGYQPMTVWWRVWMGILSSAGYPIALAIGLWTIGGIASQVDRLVQLEAEGDADR